MKAMIEIVDPGKRAQNSPIVRHKHTLEVHTEGGGDPEALLFRMTSPVGTACMLVDKDDARMLFSWLGAWLHGAPIGEGGS